MRHFSEFFKNLRNEKEKPFFGNINTHIGIYFVYSQAGLIPRPSGAFQTGKTLVVRVLNPHNIHTLQNDDTPLLCGGVRHFFHSARPK
jgi:hypothetical protein